MEYKRFGGRLLVRIDKDEEIGECTGTTCYPYIFPTIFPRAAAGMLIWFEYTASQGGCLY